MLVLSRKKDEAIQIGGDIHIKVLEVNGSYVKLGISAPSDVGIVREEILETVKQENIASLATQKPKQESIPGFLKEKGKTGS